jgi:hypothetical protein
MKTPCYTKTKMEDDEKLEKLKDRVREIQVNEVMTGFRCSLCKRKWAIKDMTAFRYGFCCDQCLAFLTRTKKEPGGYIWLN